MAVRRLLALTGVEADDSSAPELSPLAVLAAMPECESDEVFAVTSTRWLEIRGTLVPQRARSAHLASGAGTSTASLTSVRELNCPPRVKHVCVLLIHIFVIVTVALSLHFGSESGAG
jgi:hypothetical protein